MATQSLTERPAAVTMRGAPKTLVGPELHAGASAPPFVLIGEGLAPFSLDDALDGGKRAALLIVVPSLDTPTCHREALTFHRRLADLPAGIAAFVVSVDLPFAQARWAKANEAEGLIYLSDYRDRSFGTAYGVLVKEPLILARATFVVDPSKKLTYASVVPEIADEPNYDEIFAAAKRAAGT